MPRTRRRRSSNNNSKRRRSRTTCFSWGVGVVLWWQKGRAKLGYVPYIIFIHLMMTPLAVLLHGGQARHHFLFVHRDMQGNRRCRTSMIHLKMVGHAIQLNCI